MWAPIAGNGQTTARALLCDTDEEMDITGCRPHGILKFRKVSLPPSPKWKAKLLLDLLHARPKESRCCRALQVEPKITSVWVFGQILAEGAEACPHEITRLSDVLFGRMMDILPETL